MALGHLFHKGVQDRAGARGDAAGGHADHDTGLGFGAVPHGHLFPGLVPDGLQFRYGFHKGTS